jgi:hypothetical protein
MTPGDLLFGHPLLDGDCGKQRSGAQQVVAAAMSGAAVDARLAFRDVLLRQAGQGIVLAHDRDHRPALAPTGRKRRGDGGDTLRHRKSGRAQFSLQQLRALVFLITDFGVLPDGPRDVAVMRGARVHLLEQRALVVGRERAGCDE